MWFRFKISFLKVVLSTKDYIQKTTKFGFEMGTHWANVFIGTGRSFFSSLKFEHFRNCLMEFGGYSYIASTISAVGVGLIYCL